MRGRRRADEVHLEGFELNAAPGMANDDATLLESNEVAIYYWVRGGTGDVRDNRCVANERDIVLAGPTSPDVGDNLPAR